jgi:hypothetical protein
MAAVSWPKGPGKWVAAFIALVAIYLVGFAAYDQLVLRPPSESRQAPQRVSLVQLIASPEKYDGHRIQAAGYFIFEEEHHALYLTDTDGEYYLPENSVALLFDYRKFPRDELRTFNRKYVNLTGRFIANARSEWPLDIQLGRSVRQIATIEELRSPPYRYGPTDNFKVLPSERR